MRSGKKLIAATVATIGALALVSGAVNAKDVKSYEKKPIVESKGDGESYSLEALAKHLGVTVKELESRVQVQEFKLSKAGTYSGTMRIIKAKTERKILSPI